MAVAGIGAGVLFAAAATALVAFFATSDARFDRVAEWSFVLFAAFAIALAVLVQQRLGAAADVTLVFTALGILGVATLGLLEGLSALGRLDFRRFGGFAALGFAGWLAWIGGISVIGLWTGVLPAPLAWLGLASVLVAFVVVGRFALDRSLIRAERSPGLAEMAPLGVVFVAIVAWLVWLGVTP